MILLKVDMRTLLHAQKVSTAFHGTIHTSPALRRKLWLSSRTTAAEEEDPKAKRMLNPFILDHRRKLYLKGLYLWQNTSAAAPKTCIVDLHFASLQHAMALRSASWCEMVVVQQHHASIQWSVGYYEGGKVKSVGFMFPDGPPTLGLLVDALLETFVPGHGQAEPAGKEEGRVEVAEEDGA
ncbi:hypothetical protein LTR85_009813 [Meristemomyces frigidus]|nr:hypothetical protein LTR85_009813 [Meristemomyces frigidus]